MPKGQLSAWTDGNGNKGENGVPAGAKIQFAGAANFPDDMSVSWSLNCQTPLMGGDGRAPVLSATGELTAPDKPWIQNNPKCLDWAVIAISNHAIHRSRLPAEIHFARCLSLPYTLD